MGMIFILVPAIALDLLLGDPPNFIHPVAWMGKIISWLERGAFRLHRVLQFLYGVALTLFTIALFAVPTYYILLYLSRLSLIASIIVGMLIFKSTFSIRGLRQAALKVKRLMQESKLDEARFELRSLVSRDTAALPRPLMVSATVESLAENTCDSLVAPLFYFLIFGTVGAIGYRVVNTLDAMIGYHGKYEYLGKFAARLDDILNFIPARITALLLILAAFIMRSHGRKSLQIALRDHTKTESPNAGWPMAAMAGALNVRLEKVGHYKLGEANTELTPEAIDTSVRLFLVAVSAWILICFIIGVR
jgi:adenosylcobinamide-phosphate synthase